MKFPTFLLSLLVAGVFSRPASAGTLTLPDFSTQWTAVGGLKQPHVESSDQWTVNLDDRAGLTPGLPIRITVTTSEHFLWLGSFKLQAGPLKITSEASLSLVLGTRSAKVSSLLVDDYGIIPSGPEEDPSAVTDPVGFIQGPGLPVLELTVPWSTDLSQAVFSLSQVSDISGPGFGSSSLTVSGGNTASAGSVFAVRFASVPEPSAVLMIAGSILCVIVRRKR